MTNDFNFDATKNFDYINGNNPMEDIKVRLDAAGAYAALTPLRKASSIITIPVATATTDNKLEGFIPAGSLVTSLGVFFTETCDVGTAGTLAVAFGIASAGEELVGSTNLNGTADIAINTFPSTENANKANAGGTAIGIADAAPLYFANAADLFFQTIVGTNVLAATCQVKVVMGYLPVSNS